MGRKIFVSYKFADSDVGALSGRDNPKEPTTVRDYVDAFEKRLDHSDSIYKGEPDDYDLSELDESTIRNKLSDRIYDSSVTVLFISPNMKVPNRWEKSQWIPWEISYSVRRETRNGITSRSNALVGVVLPDRHGSYNYYSFMDQFRIVKSNIKSGYMVVERWDRFIGNIDKYVKLAVDQKSRIMPDKQI